MAKITAYGVRPNERPYFDRLNHDHFEMTYVADLLTYANVDRSRGADGVLVRGNCVVDRENLRQFAKWGIQAVFTRSVGVNHIDLAAAAEFGIQIARVPGYSPYAVAELALTLGLSLFRHVDAAVQRTRQGDFRVPASYFSRELHTATVGIIGAGRIGMAEARLYRGLGAQVMAYTPHPKVADRQVVTFGDRATVLGHSDIVSVHVPYIPGENDQSLDQQFLAQMKPQAVLVNTARGELADPAAILHALDAGQLGGYGADVVTNETQLIGQDFGQAAAVPDAAVRQLLAHPRVMVTPHMGSFTEPALEDMIKVSYQNFREWWATGRVTNGVSVRTHG